MYSSSMDPKIYVMMAEAVTFWAQLTVVLQKQVVDYVKFINNRFMLHYKQHAKHNRII